MVEASKPLLIVYREDLRRHCEVAALILTHLKKTSQSQDHVRYAIRRASDQVSEIRGGTNKLKARWMSEAARAQMEAGDASRLVAEHMVPVRVILEQVMTGLQVVRLQEGANAGAHILRGDGHEGAELKEARIDLAHRVGVRPGHAIDELDAEF